MTNNLADIECFVFDMDGTIYLEDKLISGSLELFKYLNENNIKYYFLTNNSSKTAEAYLKKLHSLSIDFIELSQIITSGDITIEYIKERFNKPNVYLVGTDDLKTDFIKSGINVVGEYGEDIDAVVIGFDTSFNYEKAAIATRYIRKGIPFISTHLDLVCPIKNREFIPDCGSITKMIEYSTDTEAKYIGKPCEETVKFLIDRVKLSKDKIAIVGDRLYTDVATGVNNGMTGIAVLTGETSLEEIKKSSINPTFVFKSINELYISIKDSRYNFNIM